MADLPDPCSKFDLLADERTDRIVCAVVLVLTVLIAAGLVGTMWTISRMSP